MNSLKMQMILMDRGINDLYRMHEYLASGGSKQTVYQLFNTQLYFPDGIIPGEEGFVETIKKAWKWLKEKVRAIVDIILNCFGIKKSSSNTSSSNSDSNSISDSDVSGTIDVKKVDKLRSEIGKTVKILNKSYDSLTKSAGGDSDYVKDIESQLETGFSKDVSFSFHKKVKGMLFKEMVPNVIGLDMLFNSLDGEESGFSVGGALNKSYLKIGERAVNLNITDLLHYVYLLMQKIYTIRNTLLEHTKTIDEKLKRDPNSPDQIIKGTKQLTEFVDNTLRYVEVIPKYLDMSLPIWKDFGPAVEKLMKIAKTVIEMLKNELSKDA